MIEVFEQHYGRTIDTLDSSKVSTLSDDVTASVMKTVTTATSSTLSSIRMEGSISRKYRLVNAEPNWSRLPAVVATVMSFNLPESIEFITSFTKMEDVHAKEIPLGHVTVKVPGMRPRGSRSTSTNHDPTNNGNVAMEMNNLSIGGRKSVTRVAL